MEDGHHPEVVAEEHPLEAADGELDLPLPDHPGHEEGGGELTYDGEEPPPPPPPPPPPHDEQQESCCSKAAADAPSEVHLEAGGAGDQQQPMKDELVPGAPPTKRSRIEDHPGDVVWESLMAQVRGQLQTFTPDECFYRSLELRDIARREVSDRCPHLAPHMDDPNLPLPEDIRPPPPMAGIRQIQHAADAVAQVHAADLEVIKPAAHAAVIYAGGGTAAGPATARVPSRRERAATVQRPVRVPANNPPLPMMKLTHPVPPHCEPEHDPEGMMGEMPPFKALENFPSSRAQGRCVMCDSAEFNIPKQNKGVCNNCDIAIWVHNPSGLLLKWCKGCKNFRKWSDFGLKGHSSKTERCRQQQAERYARSKNNKSDPSAAVMAQREMGMADVPGEQPRVVDQEQAEMHANAAALAAGQVQAHHLHSVIHHAQAQPHMDGTVLEAPVHHETNMII